MTPLLAFALGIVIGGALTLAALYLSIRIFMKTSGALEIMEAE